MLRIIVNPVSGGGRALGLVSEVRKTLEAHYITYDERVSEKPGDVTRMVTEAIAEGVNGVVLMGGDGTLYEAVNGLGDTHYTLYFVPCGTGNDFIKCIGLYANDPIRSLQLQLEGVPRTLDVVRLNDMHYVNISGSGFDIEVLRQTERYKKRFKGLLPYLLGLIQSLRRYRPLHVRMTVDGVISEREVTIVEIANGQYIGGGMRVAPMADPSDGMLDVVYIDRVPTIVIALLLPFFIPGWVNKLPIAHHQRVERVTLEAPGMTLNIDGELLPIDRAEYAIVKGQISIRVPARTVSVAADVEKSMTG